MEVTEVKNILNNQNIDEDYLSTAIPLFIDYANNYCNQSYASNELPGGVKVFVAKACEYNMQKVGLKSFRMGEVSYSYETDFPKTLKDYLKPYRRVGFN